MTRISAPSADPGTEPVPAKQLGYDALRDMLRRELRIGGTDASNGPVTSVLMLELRRVNRVAPLGSLPTGEAVIDHACNRLDRILRPADRYARISTEQLCIVLPGLADSSQSILAAIRILAALQRPFGIGDQEVRLRPHIGVAASPEHSRDPDQLLILSDVAARISATREEGYHFYRPEDHVEAEIYRGVDIELARAIRNNELEVHYQPQIDLRTGRCLAAEALLRWPAPGDREITTGALITIAEQTGLIAPLTTWVINTVLRHCAELARMGITPGFSINLSTLTLADDQLPDVVQHALGTWDVDATRITFEITEGSMIGDVERSLKLLHRLRALGLRLAIDDFGTGYSSLAYLKRFPLQELKIDKMFVQHMREQGGDKRIVRSVIDLAHNFDLRAVAEGVEDEATLAELRELGCDLVQGYLFSPALSRDEFADWYRRQAG